MSMRKKVKIIAMIVNVYCTNGYIVYSPFVESELSRLLKKQNNFQDAVNYLVLALEHAKNIKPEDEVKLYYDILTLYDSLGQKEQKEIYLQKCKNINIEDNFYKNMCNGMNP